MKALTDIGSRFRSLRDISGIHLLLAALSAFFITAIALYVLPLNLIDLSAFQLIVLIVISVTPLFFFYALNPKPMRSVFWFIKWVYYIVSPFILIFIAYLLFNRNKALSSPQSYYSTYVLLWAVVWFAGTIIFYLLSCLLSIALKSGISNGNAVARFFYDLAVMFTPQKRVSEQKREGRKKWTAAYICMFLIALGAFIFAVTLFLFNIYSNMEFEAILFTMRFAKGGLATEDIIIGTEYTLIFLIITLYFSFHLLKCFKNDQIVVQDTCKEQQYTLIMNGKKRAFLIVLSLFMLFLSTGLFSVQTNFLHHVGIKFKDSTIYENYYVEPDQSVIEFPEEKRNLIYIYVESMENTYASKEAGGDLDINYISDLTKLTMDSDCVNFSNTELLGGASVFVPAISYTMGSTVAQTSGITTDTEIFPLFGPVEFPVMTRLEDILHDNGYNQVYIEGSKGEFSMYDEYVGRYDDSKVYDRTSLAEEGYSDENEDYIWKWGIEDKKLYEITKELISDLSQKDKPFFVTMYTMDTHSYEAGHRCPECDENIKDDYLASIECSSRQAFEFVNWVKQQPFYENTTVILVGDHLGNKKTSKVSIDDDYVRTTYNCFINPAKRPVNSKNRIFSSLDMFPTTLSSIGVDIKGDRLGLGTDLFSERPTLCEELGKEEYMDQLERNSRY